MEHEFTGQARLMSKPKWAPHNGKWALVKPKFWSVWHANKESLRKSGYELRKTETGEWQIRYIASVKDEWPERNPKSVFVPFGSKASLCLKCGNVDLIDRNENHRACTLCGRAMGESW